MDIDFGINDSGIWEKVQIGVWCQKNGLTEFLVDTHLIFWISVFVFWGDKYQKMSTNSQKIQKQQIQHLLKLFAEFPDIWIKLQFGRWSSEGG